jgi:hypothetical protein
MASGLKSVDLCLDRYLWQNITHITTHKSSLMQKFLSLLLVMTSLTACSGGSSGGGGGARQGPTSHAGFWELRAAITAIVGGSTNDINTTSQVRIESNGAVSILTTDTDCALTIFVNGNTMTYEESCVFPGTSTEDSTGAPCTLDLKSVATFTSSTSASGVFGPKSLVCVGSAASYSGTLVALRNGTLLPPPVTPPDPDPTDAT